MFYRCDVKAVSLVSDVFFTGVMSRWHVIFMTVSLQVWSRSFTSVILRWCYLFLTGVLQVWWQGSVCGVQEFC